MPLEYQSEASITKIIPIQIRHKNRSPFIELPEIEEWKLGDSGVKNVRDLKDQVTAATKVTADVKDVGKTIQKEKDSSSKKEQSPEDQKTGDGGGKAEPHSKHKHRRRRAHNGKSTGKKERRFHASSNSEVFYRTKVAQAEKTVEALQKLHVEEEKQKEKLRSRWKREQVQRKAMEKEMEIMRMKLAAAGLE